MYIKPIELVILLATFWLPVFALAAVIQWRMLGPGSRYRRWLLAVVPFEALLAFAILVSPVHQFFLPLQFLGPALQPGAFPLQAATASAIVATAIIWAGGRLGRSA